MAVSSLRFTRDEIEILLSQMDPSTDDESEPTEESNMNSPAIVESSPQWVAPMAVAVFIELPVEFPVSDTTSPLACLLPCEILLACCT